MASVEAAGTAAVGSVQARLVAAVLVVAAKAMAATAAVRVALMVGRLAAWARAVAWAMDQAVAATAAQEPVVVVMAASVRAGRSRRG